VNSTARIFSWVRDAAKLRHKKVRPSVGRGHGDITTLSLEGASVNDRFWCNTAALSSHTLFLQGMMEMEEC
jgi:hypothetical protein